MTTATTIQMTVAQSLMKWWTLHSKSPRQTDAMVADASLPSKNPQVVGRMLPVRPLEQGGSSTPPSLCPITDKASTGR